jgi:hypothetical protein
LHANPNGGCARRQPVLLLAAPFACVAWAFGGPIGLLAFVAPLALLVALVAALAVLTRQVAKDE